MAQILLVEDEKISQIKVLEALSEHTIMLAENYQEAIRLLDTHPFDVAILDIILPSRQSGLDICTYIRKSFHTRNMEILILSKKDSEMEKVHGLELGADDYLSKPFSMKELSARISTMIRRKNNKPSTYRVGFLEFDYENQKAYSLEKIRKVDLKLTPIEFKLLNLLSSSPNTIFNEVKIAEQISSNEKVSEKSLSMHISSLRKKIEFLGLIKRVKKSGYFIEFHSSISPSDHVA